MVFPGFSSKKTNPEKTGFPYGPFDPAEVLQHLEVLAVPLRGEGGKRRQQVQELREQVGGRFFFFFKGLFVYINLSVFFFFFDF